MKTTFHVGAAASGDPRSGLGAGRALLCRRWQRLLHLVTILLLLSLSVCNAQTLNLLEEGNAGFEAGEPSWVVKPNATQQTPPGYEIEIQGNAAVVQLRNSMPKHAALFTAESQLGIQGDSGAVRVAHVPVRIQGGKTYEFGALILHDFKPKRESVTFVLRIEWDHGEASEKTFQITPKDEQPQFYKFSAPAPAQAATAHAVLAIPDLAKGAEGPVFVTLRADDWSLKEK